MLGDSDFSINSILVNGSENSLINTLFSSVLGSSDSESVVCGLVPSTGYIPEEDNNASSAVNGTYIDYNTSHVTNEDIAAVEITDNGDGTITMKLQPFSVEVQASEITDESADSMTSNSQTRFFQSMEAMSSSSMFSSMFGGDSEDADTAQSPFSSDDSDGGVFESAVLTLGGGIGTVTIDTSTKEILSADYELKVTMKAENVSIAVIKNKDIEFSLSIKNHFPADEEYIEDAGLI